MLVLETVQRVIEVEPMTSVTASMTAIMIILAHVEGGLGYMMGDIPTTKQEW